jgi:hypothetical protein
MKTFFPAILLLIFSHAVLAQNSRLGEHCDLSVLGESDTKDFLTFDRELRSALSRNDAVLLMALLVSYPLRVNGDRGSWYIQDSPSFQLRFQEIFPPAVRATVLNSKPDSLHCSFRGVMYGNGTVWINGALVAETAGNPTSVGFAVVAINLPSKPGAATRNSATGVEFVGRTSKYRLIVDHAADQRSRLRLWTDGQSLLAKATWEIRDGTKVVEGTCPCVHAIWTFKMEGSKFVVNELGCYPDSNQPPSGATGQLEIEGMKDSEGWWWLF